MLYLDAGSSAVVTSADSVPTGAWSLAAGPGLGSGWLSGMPVTRSLIDHDVYLAGGG